MQYDKMKLVTIWTDQEWAAVQSGAKEHGKDYKKI